MKNVNLMELTKTQRFNSLKYKCTEAHKYRLIACLAQAKHEFRTNILIENDTILEMCVFVSSIFKQMPLRWKNYSFVKL